MTIASYAQRLIAAIPPDRRDLLRVDPRAAIASAGFTIRDVPELTAPNTRDGSPGRWCDGITLHDQDVILIAPTPDSRRESFTLLHEYTHVLADDDAETVDWLADRPQRADDLEALCDEVAGRLLIPDGELDAVVGRGPIRARHLQELHLRNQHASQMSCAVALARRLPCAGAVVLSDRVEHRVVFAAHRGDLHPRPRRNVPVPPAHPLRRVTSGAPLTTSSYWAEPWGERTELYLDATASNRRSYAVMVVDDLWGLDVFHGGRRELVHSDRPSQRRRCPCGLDREIFGWPCDACDHISCPDCGRCDCQRRDAQRVRCRRCTISYPPRDMTDGLCSNCS